MVEADKPTIIVANCEVILEDDETRRSRLCKSVGYLFLGIAEFETEMQSHNL